MLYVKIMSAEDKGDADVYKNFTVIPIENHQVLEFTDVEDQKTSSCPRYEMRVHDPEGGHETHPLTGNAYVMNESGKTIATHGC